MNSVNLDDAIRYLGVAIGFGMSVYWDRGLWNFFLLIFRFHWDSLFYG
jgi:hypothetical protein